MLLIQLNFESLTGNEKHPGLHDSISAWRPRICQQSCVSNVNSTGLKKTHGTPVALSQFPHHGDGDVRAVPDTWVRCGGVDQRVHLARITGQAFG